MEEGGFRRRRYMTLVLSGCYAVAFVDRALVGVAGVAIKHDLRLSDFDFGLLNGTAFAALFCIAGIPLGWLADRCDQRALIAVALLFWTAMTALCGLAPSPAVFFLARVGVGLGEAALVPAAMSLMGGSVPQRQLARAVAVFLLGATFGNVIALLAGGTLLGLFTASPAFGLAPWRTIFLLACPPGLVMAALVLTILRPASARVGQDQTLRSAVKALREEAPAYGYLTAATACNIVLAQAQAAWLPIFYSRHFGLAPAQGATAVGVLFLMSAPLGQGLGGSIIDGLQRRGVAAPANTMMMVCAALALPLAILFTTADTLFVSEAFYVLFNLVVCAATPAGLTGWQLLISDRRRGVTIALLMAIVTFIGVGIGPAAVGLLTDQVFRDERDIGLSLGLLLSCAAVLGFWAARRGRAPFAAALARKAAIPT
ncbi:MAG: MFS transporter [Rhizomicrobium sp.]